MLIENGMLSTATSLDGLDRYISIYIFVYINIDIFRYIYVHKYVQVCAYLYTFILLFVSIDIYICAYERIYTYEYICIKILLHRLDLDFLIVKFEGSKDGIYDDLFSGKKRFLVFGWGFCCFSYLILIYCLLLYLC
jgi:hypothetical protein